MYFASNIAIHGTNMLLLYTLECSWALTFACICMVVCATAIVQYDAYIVQYDAYIVQYDAYIVQYDVYIV
jgi:hypothetical protein